MKAAAGSNKVILKVTFEQGCDEVFQSLNQPVTGSSPVRLTIY